MKELELLKELLETEHELQIQVLNVRYAETEEQRQIESAKKQSIENKVDLLKTQLTNVEDKSESEKAKFAIVRQLNAYVEETNKARPGLKLSRSQGMILENMLFGYISKDIHNLVSDRVFGIHIPAYLSYTYESKNSVEISDLTVFLNNEIQIVKAIKNPNYVNLKEYYSGFRERIINEFIEHN